jgi:2-polyprenyl-3-methyl-5-hydroxy-6-metoxy-1,4-benzoquinol methylase
MSKNWTGERLETEILNSNTLEHLHRYALAQGLVSGKSVLDIACGEGYGTNLLSQVAQTVVGVDISEETVQHAQSKYKKSNLAFRAGRADKILAEDSSFDVVVSFETIEHHDKHIEMMQEIKRVLKPQGVLIISSPDKLNYSIKRKYANPYHVKELFIEEFKGLIQSHFKYSLFFQQRSMYCSAIVPEHQQSTSDLDRFSGSYQQINKNSFDPLYHLCIASNEPVPHFAISFFDDNIVIKNQIEQAIQTVRNSFRYKIGNILMFPFSIFKAK